MLWRMIQTGVFAGFLTALAYSVVQAVTITPLLFQAEAYEAAASSGHGAVEEHVHEDGQVHLHQQGGDTSAEASEPWQPDDGLERYGFTFLANIVTAVGFGFVLAAAFAIWGRPVDMRAGLWWGLGGFAVFALNPSLGLPPEVPGAAAADLVVRQYWWFGAMAATAVGLGLLVLLKAIWLRAAGVVFILLPHFIGAPHPVGADPGPVPPELASLYVVWSLVTTLFFWLVLGGSAGDIYRRLSEAQTVAAEPAE